MCVWVRESERVCSIYTCVCTVRVRVASMFNEVSVKKDLRFYLAWLHCSSESWKHITGEHVQLNYWIVKQVCVRTIVIPFLNLSCLVLPFLKYHCCLLRKWHYFFIEITHDRLFSLIPSQVLSSKQKLFRRYTTRKHRYPASHSQSHDLWECQLIAGAWTKVHIAYRPGIRLLLIQGVTNCKMKNL